MVFMVEKLHKINPLWKVVLGMFPSVQSSLKSVSLRDITRGRKTKLNTSSKVVLVMTPSVQSLLKLVSLLEIAGGRRNKRTAGRRAGKERRARGWP